jgi:hypothetical protein
VLLTQSLFASSLSPLLSPIFFSHPLPCSHCSSPSCLVLAHPSTPAFHPILYYPALPCLSLCSLLSLPTITLTLPPKRHLTPIRCSSYNKRLAKKGALKVRTDSYVLLIQTTFSSYFFSFLLISTTFICSAVGFAPRIATQG